MRRALIDPDNPWWRNALGYLAAAIILPIAIVAKLLILPFERLFARPIERTPEEVARILREFIDGTGGDWDFDDFECNTIADPLLDSIRDRASRVAEPMTEEGLATLRALLAEAEALAEQPDAPFRSA